MIVSHRLIRQNLLLATTSHFLLAVRVFRWLTELTLNVSVETDFLLSQSAGFVLNRQQNWTCSGKPETLTLVVEERHRWKGNPRG